jgi:hypothetical protein
MAYCGHWVTPANRERRFDTRFFISPAPEGQQATHDNAEIVECLWLTPREILDRAARGSMELMNVTRQIVAGLAQFESVQDALAAAHSVTDVEANRLCYAVGRDGRRIFRAGDAPYAEVRWTDPDETGNSTYDLLPGRRTGDCRYRPRAGRFRAHRSHP